MTLTHLATNRVIITRMTAVSGYKSVLTTVTAAIVNLQPISAEKTALMGGIIGKTFKIFCDSGIDIQEHDRLRDNISGKEYRVRAGGVTLHSYFATEYYEVLIEEIK